MEPSLRFLEAASDTGLFTSRCHSLVESVHIFAVSRQAAGARECPAADRAGLETAAGMVSHVCRQYSRLRAGLTERDRRNMCFARQGRGSKEDQEYEKARLSAGSG